jgi:hypothetical protein
VVRVSASVVTHSGADVLGDVIEVGEEFLEVTGVCFGVLLQRVIEVGDVGIVVFFVVEVHGLFVYVRFERVIGIG